MEQHAGPAGAEHNDLFASGRFDGVELHDGLTGGFGREIFGGAFLLEEFEFVTATAAGVALLRHAIACAGQGENADACEGLAIEIQDTVAGGDQYVAKAIGVRTCTWKTRGS